MSRRVSCYPATQRVLVVDGGMSAFVATYPFLVAGHDKFSDAEYPTEVCVRACVSVSVSMSVCVVTIFHSTRWWCVLLSFAALTFHHNRKTGC